MIRPGAFAFAVVIGLAPPLAAQNGDPVETYAADDRKMNAAIRAARRSLPLFLCEATDAEGYGAPGGFLKVRVPVDHPEITHEVIWVGPFVAWTGHDFAGFLSNQPNAMPGYNAGDQFDFTYDMIVDWSWSRPAGQTFGGYTTRLILQHSARAEDLARLKRYATPPAPADWTCQDPAS